MILADVRGLVREIQLSVYKTGRAGKYHAGKARDLIGDLESVTLKTTAVDPQVYQQCLPILVQQINEIDESLEHAWHMSRTRDENYLELENEISSLFDAVSLRPRIYERLVRQSEKPLIKQAIRCSKLSRDHKERLAFEDLLRMRVDEFLDLENGIAARLTTIDELRDGFAAQFHEFATDCASNYGDGSSMAHAGAKIGLRWAVNCYDERNGHEFTDYSTFWIKRELSRIGIAKNE